MSYSYYRNHGPSWGTSQYQFAAPPAPSWQPQPNWGGYDYYRAHAPDADNSVWDYAWSRAKNLVGAGGVSKDEAKQWHQRIYGGMVDVRSAEPHELGAAAAYEAYRTWKYNSSLYEPLSGDRDRQREALIGLSIGEAERLWQSSGRRDGYGRKETSEHAASTASRIWTFMINNQREAYNRTPYGSRPSSPHRSNSSHRSSSPYRSGSPYRPPSPYHGGSAYGSAYNGSAYGQQSYGDGYGGGYQQSVPSLHRSSSHSSLRGGGTPIMAQPTAILPGYQGTYAPTGYLGTSPSMNYNAPLAPAYGYAQPMTAYNVAQYGTQGYAQPMAQQQVQYINGQPVPAGSTVIIDSGGSHSGSHHRSRRHSHSSHGGHHHRRSSSASVSYVQPGYNY